MLGGVGHSASSAGVHSSRFPVVICRLVPVALLGCIQDLATRVADFKPEIDRGPAAAWPNPLTGVRC